MLQQYLPFTVLKQALVFGNHLGFFSSVATVPTVYGIETINAPVLEAILYLVATVPTVYGIETNYVLNVLVIYSCNSTYRLRY